MFSHCLIQSIASSLVIPGSHFILSRLNTGLDSVELVFNGPIETTVSIGKIEDNLERRSHYLVILKTTLPPCAIFYFLQVKLNSHLIYWALAYQKIPPKWPCLWLTKTSSEFDDFIKITTIKCLLITNTLPVHLPTPNSTCGVTS